ncbi:MAG TPA: hypothetical protein VJV78_21860 [Polyangiales bacterium]|nr:hypothetical protein [Polyangiales bacterium]
MKQAAQSSRANYAERAVTNFISSAVLLGAAIWLAVDTDGAFDEPGPTLGVMLSLLNGSFGLVSGIALATTTSAAEERLERWRATRRSGELDPITLARFEGELAAQARSDYGDRFWLSNFAWLATAISGGAMLALTAATADTKDERVGGYLMSGVFLSISAVNLLFAESDTFGQRVWREYVEAVRDPTQRKQLLEPPAPPPPPAVHGPRR